MLSHRQQGERKGRLDLKTIFGVDLFIALDTPRLPCSRGSINDLFACKDAVQDTFGVPSRKGGTTKGSWPDLADYDCHFRQGITRLPVSIMCASMWV